MYSNNKQIRDVAAVAAQIMSGQTVTEKLHPNQQKIDVVDDEKIDAKDFAKLRAMKNKVKEEVELEEELNLEDYSLEELEIFMESEEFQQIDEISRNTVASYLTKKQSGYTKSIKGKSDTTKRKYEKEYKADIEPASKRKSAYDAGASGKWYDKKRSEYKGVVKKYYDKGEALRDAVKSATKKHNAAMSKLKQKSMKVEVEQIEEKKYEPEPPNAEAIARKKRLDAIRDRQEEKNRGNKSTSNVRKVEGNRYGGAKQKDEMDESVSFTSLLNTYKEGGLKPFLESLSKEEEEQLIDDLSKDIADETMDVIDAGEYTEVTIGEEADTAEFTKTLETNKLKASGRVKQPNLAKGDVMAVKNEEVEQVEERHMTDAEMNKRETIVKSMKKGLSGFKQRYGDKAKNVMYATATKQSMK